tara:strand:+ start:761 stop:961 length:201 start_codon:yes stop_codon:yes gene_type:complete
MKGSFISDVVILNNDNNKYFIGINGAGFVDWSSEKRDAKYFKPSEARSQIIYLKMNYASYNKLSRI